MDPASPSAPAVTAVELQQHQMPLQQRQPAPPQSSALAVAARLLQAAASEDEQVASPPPPPPGVPAGYVAPGADPAPPPGHGCGAIVKQKKRTRERKPVGQAQSKARKAKGAHKNAWLKSYYVCLHSGCDWGGSAKTRHANARPQCRAVPECIKFEPGSDISGHVKQVTMLLVLLLALLLLVLTRARALSL